MDLAALVCRYAERFAGLGGEEHRVGSPLGAWLVLALAAPAATGALREEITEALGTDVESAQALLAQLLTRPNSAVGAALAAWSVPGLTGLDTWRAGLPASVSTGGVPTQRQADAWAREHTLGLIDTFPVDVAQAVIVLASALATRVTWLRPFDLIDGHELRGSWGRRLTRVLHAPAGRAGRGHEAFIVATKRAGDVAVHSALADADLEVTSVIAAADVARADVLAVAHEIATTRAVSRSAVSLFDLPVGDSPLWTITERDSDAGGEHVEAVLPAWHANSRHDLLTVPALGLGAAGTSLSECARVQGLIQAVQTAVASYSRRGFEAAAVTALAFPLSLTARLPGPCRIATLRFGHPYAVVATTRGAANDPWSGLPVFAAWISEPDDAGAD